jgi:hypothetical protein
MCHIAEEMPNSTAGGHNDTSAATPRFEGQFDLVTSPLFHANIEEPQFLEAPLPDHEDTWWVREG